MGNSNKNIGSLFEQDYKDVIKHHIEKGNKVISTHYGTMSAEDVNDIAFEIEQKMLEEGEKKGIIKRIFNLVVEILQNIRLHGEADDDGVQQGYYILVKEGNDFISISSNIALNSNLERITTKIDKINQMDKVALKEYYMEVLTDGKISVKGGAGLGFITVAMKSKNKLDYTFREVTDAKSKFDFSTKIIAAADE